MKKYSALLLILFASMASCQNKMENCVEKMKKDGYSHEEAVSACEDAQIESQIR